MKRSLAGLVLWPLVLACAETETGGDEEAIEPAADTAAADTVAPSPSAAAAVGSATMHDADGRTLGSLTLSETEGGVAVTGTLGGLPPGEHGFHIHETGSCEPPSFSSAGAHLAGGATAHGFDVAGGPHAGDLRNLVAGPDSTAIVEQTNPRVILRNGEVALLDADGSAIVVHEHGDDYATQPSGGSGDRIACGVVQG